MKPLTKPAFGVPLALALAAVPAKAGQARQDQDQEQPFDNSSGGGGGGRQGYEDPMLNPDFRSGYYGDGGLYDHFAGHGVDHRDRRDARGERP